MKIRLKQQKFPPSFNLIIKYQKKIINVLTNRLIIGVTSFLIYPVLMETLTFYFGVLNVELNYKNVQSIANYTSFVLTLNVSYVLTASFLGIVIILPIALPLLAVSMKYIFNMICYEEEQMHELALFFSYPILSAPFFFFIGDYFIKRNINSAFNDTGDLLDGFAFGYDEVIPVVIMIIMLFVLREWIIYGCKKGN